MSWGITGSFLLCENWGNGSAGAGAAGDNSDDVSVVAAGDVIDWMDDSVLIEDLGDPFSEVVLEFMD